jgi:hypothetical protein
MDKQVSLFTKILIVITGFGLIAVFVFAMLAIEKRVAAEYIFPDTGKGYYY